MKNKIKTPEKTVTYKDIRKAVNEFDKEFGIDLKDPEIWAEPELFSEIILEKARFDLLAELVMVNGIPLLDYFDYNTMNMLLPINTISTIDPLFVTRSILSLDKKYTRYSDSSLIFRARYVSYVIELCCKNLDKILKNMSGGKKSVNVHENQIINTKKFMDIVIKFIEIVLNPSSTHTNVVLKMHEFTSYKYKKVPQLELKNALGSKVIMLKRNMKELVLHERFYTDDMAIFEIISIAFMLATNNPNTRKLPKFKYLEGATVKHNLIKVIESLGAEIIAMNGPKNYPIMFLSYMKARPSIQTQFVIESQESLEIATGLAALQYAKFVINDRNIDSFIDEMMMKGI